MKSIILFLFFAINLIWAQDTTYPKAKVSFDDFSGLVGKVEPLRATRLIDFDTFLEMSQEPGVIILDSRSKSRFERIHLKGAKHLAFSEFTQDSLAQVIPSFDTKILIYCNNNFDGNQTDFKSKISISSVFVDSAASSQLAAQEKPLMMALNIPTYINLYGYGYRNVYELHELVKVGDSRVPFEGTTIELKRPRSRIVALIADEFSTASVPATKESLSALPAPPTKTVIANRLPAMAPTLAADLLIISATYGSGTNYKDVTNRVNDLFRQPDAVFFARPEWLSADPTPGWNKTLVIVYEVKGQRRTFATGEGGKVSVSLLLDTDK